VLRSGSEDVQRKNDLVSAGTLSATAAALSQGYCTYQGCWTIVDSAHETFRGSVYYFYGSTQLGQVTLTANVLLNVYTIRTLPFASLSSRGTRTTVLVGDRLYVSDYYPGGNTESFGAYRQQTSCSARGSGISCAWIPSTGYSTRETTVQKVTMLSETTWSDPSSAYPGHWHFWAKSVEADRATNGTGYHFGVLTLPVTPASAGWTAT
jgi:hypothetical protein